jgi:hypothetical protein
LREKWINNKIMSLKEEIIDILKDVYYNNDQADQFDEKDADRILKLIEKRIGELYDKTNYIDSADLLYSDIKDMLKQK